MQNDMKKELDELFAFGQEVIGLLEQEIRQRDNDYKDTKDRLEQMKQSLRNLLRD